MPSEDYVPEPNLFRPQKAFDSSINEAILASEIEGGVRVNELRVGTKLRIKTENTTYLLEINPDGKYLSGHPQICPKPTLITINGSTFGGSMLKKDYIGIGMYLEFHTSGKNKKKGTTTKIEEVEIIS